ncbi:MAG: ShlB/FhaC/HecB family hemolysin secretion/activation protein [Bacteroidota bacterium]
MKKWGLVLAATAATVGGSVSLPMAWAAVPGAVDPNRIEREFEPPALPQSSGEGIVTPTIPGTVAPPGAEAASFTLTEVVIDGSTVYTAEALRPFYEDFLGRTASVKTLYDIAATITARYTGDGYILSQVVVPPQTIGDDGIVHLRVVEGSIDQVIIKGDGAAAVNDLLQGYAKTIRAETPLKLATLERCLLLASDLPGATVRGTLKPSDTVTGAADLIFDVERKPVAMAASLDNRGSRYIGPWRTMTTADLNGVINGRDHTSLTYATVPQHTEQLQYGHLIHEETLDDEGTKLAFDAGYTQSHPGWLLKEDQVRNHAEVAGVEISRPVIRSRAETLTLTARFEARDSGIDQYVNETVSNDSLRSARLSAAYDWADAWAGQPAASLLTLEVAQGLNVLGATRSGSANPSVKGGHSDFIKFDAEIIRTQRLYGPFALQVGARAQVAGSTLLSAEQVTLGGVQYGRAYDAGVLAGDHGLAGKAELQYAGPEIPMLKDWLLYGFWDGGRIWRMHPTEDGENGGGLTSVGAGLRGDINDWASFELELAKPLTHVDAEDRGMGVRGFATLVVRY